MDLQWNEIYNNFKNDHLVVTMRNNKSLLLNQSGIFRQWQIWFPTTGQSLSDGCPPVVASFLTQTKLSLNGRMTAHGPSSTSQFPGTAPMHSDSNQAPYWARDSTANALELRLGWTNPSIYNIPPRINHYFRKSPLWLTGPNYFKQLIFIINECIASHIHWFSGAIDTKNWFQIGIGHRVVETSHQKPLRKKNTFPLV